MKSQKPLLYLVLDMVPVVVAANDIAKPVFDNLFENGFLTSLCGGNTLRLAPPLIITKNDINLFVSALRMALKTVTD